MIGRVAKPARKIRGQLLVLAGAMSLLTAGIALASARGDVPPLEYSAEQLVLRLHDLPPGYYPFDSSEGAGREFICEPLQPGEPGPRLKRFVERYSPAGCVGLYLRAYRVPGVGPTSAVVGTGVMDVGSDVAAISGFDLAGRLLGKLIEPDPLEEVSPPETIGAATRLFHWKDVPRIFRNGPKASFVAWRSGTVLAATYATASSLATSDRIALDLARRQQAHIENPTPYTEAERDASEVELDNPALNFPVYWLGHDFEPGQGLPVAHLEGGMSVSPEIGLPGQKLMLSYSGNLTLSSWSEAGWKRLLAKAPPGALRLRRCAKPTQVTLANGHATVFAGYRKATKPCPDGRPNRYFAIARIAGTVTAVNVATCRFCLPWFPGPYNSLKGMKAIVRGLQLRPKPVYPAARR